MNNDNKICKKCKQNKSLNDFHKSKSYKDGYRSKCRNCINEEIKKRRLQNPERERNKLRNFRKNNPDYDKNWRENNSEKVIEASKKYYYKNLEARRKQGTEYAKNWQKNNPEKANLRNQKRKAKINENGVFLITNKFIKKLYSSECVNCGSKEKIQMDHIIPIARGGRHSEGNLQPLCQSCNCSKQEKFMTEWKMLLRKY